MDIMIDLTRQQPQNGTMALIQGLSDAIITAVSNPDQDICIIVAGVIRCCNPLVFQMAHSIMNGEELPFSYAIRRRMPNGNDMDDDDADMTNRFPDNVTRIISIL